MEPQPQQMLDPDHEQILEGCFKQKLQQEIENQTEYVQIGNFLEFEKMVLEKSLIHTIFCKTHPEIGNFLHTPEIDPRLVRNYDYTIIKNCVEQCIYLGHSRIEYEAD